MNMLYGLCTDDGAQSRFVHAQACKKLQASDLTKSAEALEGGGEDGIRTHDTLLRYAPLAGFLTYMSFLLACQLLAVIRRFGLYGWCTGSVQTDPERIANFNLRILCV